MTRVTNSKGQWVERNYGVEGHDSTYRCEGCGRKFTARVSYPSAQRREYALNKGRAVRHAATCKGAGA